MDSEFYNVALDRVRYSLVWEDSRTLYHALNLRPTDEVLVITSAGCNALNALLAGPRRVTALDLNPAQNQLLAFKCHLIAHYPHRVLRRLLGLEGPAQVAACWAQVAPTLPAELHAAWAPFFERHPGGLLTAGRLETYLSGFLPTLSAATQARLRRLLRFRSVRAQAAFFERELHFSNFRAQFIRYFDAANLSQGRDPRLFRYAAESGGAAFYARLREQLGTQLARTNFFLRFFFFGPEHLPEAILPPCYQRRHFTSLRERLPRLRLAQGEATDFLLSAAGQRITKASLSNIFEYVSAGEFGRVMRALLLGRPTARPLRLVFWNLLQNQGATHPDLPAYPTLPQALTATDACFYFRNVRVLDSQLAAPRPRTPVPSPLAYAAVASACAGYRASL